MHLKILVNDTTELELTDVDFGKAVAIVTLAGQETETLKTLVSLLDPTPGPHSYIENKKKVEQSTSNWVKKTPPARRRKSQMGLNQAVEAIRLLIEGKMGHQQIARRVKISKMALQQIAYGTSWQWLSGFTSGPDRVKGGGAWDDPKWTGWNHKTVQPGPEARARMSKKGRRGINPFM